MKRLFLLALSFAPLGACSAQAPAAKDFMGQWKISKFIAYTKDNREKSLSQDLIGHVLAVSPKKLSLTMEDWTCNASEDSQVELIDTAAYVEQHEGIAAHTAQLPSTTSVLSTGDCLKIYWLDQSHIEFNFGGAFVVAEKQ